MYCDQDETVLTWDSYNPRYKRIAGKHPWMLSPQEQGVVEAAIKPCPYGGHFTFASLPRCPSCNRELPDLVPSRIYMAIVGRRIDGDKEDIWLEA